tara:strand:- start:786 stop:2264 length:1479 start_codon:yes stop_codon:yes gene_type:complete
MQYRLGELFSGPGGMSLGAMMAELDDGSEVHKIVHQWASDYDKDSCQTYTRNICPDSPNSVYHCDVRNLDISSLAPIDILAFGFPCNDFSIVGETKGIDGKFGMLYQYGVKVLEEWSPMAFVAENVSGIKGANDGKAWQKITADLEKAGTGYDLYVHHYYFEHYGVPQMRHRYIIVGIRKDLKLKFQHPEPTTKENPLTCYDALHNPEIPKGTSHHEIRELQSQVQERLSFIKPGDNAWSEDIPPRLRLNVKGARLSNIYRRMHRNLPAYTITGSGGGGTHGYHWSEPRALTNREKARVQTFPDSYEFVGGATSVRKQIGMAVPPVGAKVIFDELIRSLTLQEKLGEPIRVNLEQSVTKDRSYLNLHLAKGRKNSKTGKIKPRPWYEMELWVDDNYPELPKEFTVETPVGVMKLHRTSNAKAGEKEKGIKKLAGKGSDRAVFGKWLKNRIYEGTELNEGDIIDIDTLEEYGTETIDFYKIEDSHFLLKFTVD